jgi:ectoine hydroxylase-related dioxygenase (phytanoyl-CoA dioxygenase family)
LTTLAIQKEISYLFRLFGRLQYHIPYVKSWRPSLDQSALPSEDFSSIRLEVSNWKVVWHQDLTIAVRERKDVEGFGPWTMKAGILHVQPPPKVMSGLLAIRLHVDESGIDNGPLRVMAGSHREGRLSAEQIGNWNKEASVVCTVPEGGALVMRPLVLHASSSCAIPRSRRVIHLEFAAAELPHGLEWYDTVAAEKPDSIPLSW